MRLRVTTVMAVVAFVIALVAAVVVYRQADPVKGAGGTPGYTDAPLPSFTSGAASAPSRSSGPPSSPSSTATSSPDIRTVFLGDDYTIGVGAPSSAKSWTRLVADSLRLLPVIVGEDGAGYAKRSVNNRNYLSLVGRVVDSHPDLVVVSGGRNDVNDDPNTLRDSAISLFRQLRQQLPHAIIVAIAPWWGDSPHPQALAKVDSAVKSAVEGVGGVYLNPGDPLSGHPGWMADDADPNAIGYKAIAAKVRLAIAPVLPR